MLLSEKNSDSLAATTKISIDFFSYKYWDVSVPYVKSKRFRMESQRHSMLFKNATAPFFNNIVIHYMSKKA